MGARTVENRLPSFMMIEASSVCNYRCPLCLWTLNRNHGFLAPATFRAFIADARQFVRRACFSGRGEPTLNDDLYDMLGDCVSAGVTTDLATNGSRLLRDVDRILDCGVDNVNVSIDADNATDYAAYRVHGVFDEVVAGMRELAAAKRRRNLDRPKLQTCTVLLQHNEQRLEPMKEFFRSLGFERFLFKSAHLGHGKLDASVEQLADQWLPRDPKLVRLRHRNEANVEVECGFREHAQLLWNGDVTRCAIDQNEAIIGNVLEARFGDIWNGARSTAITHAIAAGGFQSCTGCEYSGRDVRKTSNERYTV